MKSEVEKIIWENKNLIYKIASKYSGYYPMEDLFQVGVIGVIKAYENYNKQSEVRFSTYAFKYILGEIIKFIGNDRTIKVSTDLLKIYKTYEKTQDCLTNKFGRKPTFEETCKFMEMEPNIVYEAIEKCGFTVSLDGMINDDNFSLEKVIGNDTRDSVDKMIDLKTEIDKLSETERKIIELRYYKDYTQSETANELGWNQVQVSRYENQILKKIKTNIAA
jgi:RNA polymerase sporulation-specific sigma factor